MPMTAMDIAPRCDSFSGPGPQSEPYGLGPRLLTVVDHEPRAATRATIYPFSLEIYVNILGGDEDHYAQLSVVSPPYHVPPLGNSLLV